MEKSLIFLLFLILAIRADYVCEVANAGADLDDPIAFFYSSPHLPPSLNYTLDGTHAKINNVPLTDNLTFISILYPDGTHTKTEEIIDACMTYFYPGPPERCNG